MSLETIAVLVMLLVRVALPVVLLFGLGAVASARTAHA